MASIEFTEETREQAERIGSADIVVGIAGAVSAEELRKRAEEVFRQLGPSFATLRFVFAWPAAGEAGTLSSSLTADPAQSLTFFPFVPAGQAGGELWAGVSAHQRSVAALAATLNARACIVLGPDLAALEAHAIQLFAYAVLERQCALVMPIYTMGKYDGLINSGILSPMSRALYGRRVRYPLAYDFAASGAMCARLARVEGNHNHGGPQLLWPVTVAATQSPQSVVGQVHVNVHHQMAAGGLDLSAVLSHVVGSLFQEIDSCAVHWQRVRGSQAIPVWGSAPEDAADGEPVDTRPMLETFLLGSRNLEEVWRLVLPPNTMLELRKLTRLAPEQFRMPDELWAGIVYDFALAYRLRTISRVHLMGALTPLYLGWVASYIGEVATMTGAAAERRLEQLAKAWEEKKPYLLSRWRWPDRFNP